MEQQGQQIDYKLEAFLLNNNGDTVPPFATVQLSKAGDTYTATTIEKDSITAIVKVINLASSTSGIIKDYASFLNGGSFAVTLKVKFPDSKIIEAMNSDKDVIIASVNAYLDAVNQYQRLIEKELLLGAGTH